MLRGRRVVILPDNDDAGIQHARKVGQSLYGKAHSVQVCILPNLKYTAKHGEDPADWVDRGGTLAELLQLARTAPYLHPQGKKATKQDYLSALSFFQYRFRLNICTDRVECNEEPLTDVVAAQIRVRMRDFGYEHATRFEDAYLAAAADNPFHPVQAYLDGLRWDGQDHIARLASYFPDVNQVFGLFLRRWLIGAVAKAYKAEQNRMLVLDGAQNLGKSHFAQWLCSPLKHLFVEGPINPDSKDDLIRLMDSWIWEVAELGSTTRRADQEALKYFLTIRQVTARKPYGKYDIIKPALASFIGTVNNEAGILSDPTGSRRFMVAHLVDIDQSYDGKEDVDQVWAQAKALYDQGETWQLKGAEADLAQQANEEYKIEDPLLSYVLQRFDVTGDQSDRLETARILKELHIDGWRLGTPRAESMALASLFKTEKQFQGAVQTYRTSSDRGYTGLTVKDRIANP
jgi:predicted P-loop ATPase